MKRNRTFHELTRIEIAAAMDSLRQLLSLEPDSYLRPEHLQRAQTRARKALESLERSVQRGPLDIQETAQDAIRSMSRMGVTFDGRAEECARLIDVAIRRGPE